MFSEFDVLPVVPVVALESLFRDSA